MKPKRSSKAHRLDIITTLPQPVIETVLCLLPIEEAARTSILSKNWRYKWTTIPILKFSHYSVSISTEESYLCIRWDISDLERERIYEDIMRKRSHAIHQVLLQRQGPIHEFNISMDADDTCFEIDQIIVDLSRNHTLKKLTLNFDGSDSYALPLSVFSLRHLTDLYLNTCNIDHIPVFNGFGSLTRLSLKCIMIDKETFLQLLSNCPKLKSLYLHAFVGDSFGLEYPSIMELFKCLPVIEHLMTYGYFIRLLAQDSVPKELRISLNHLKYCTIEDMCFVDGHGLPFLCVLIKCSPNLEKIKLEINTNCCYDIKRVKFVEHASIKFEEFSAQLEEYSAKLKEYSNVWLERLNEVEIKFFGNFKPELEFVKFIIARSPGLKKVILRTYGVNKNEELEMLEILSRVPHISPFEIIVEILPKRVYVYS